MGLFDAYYDPGSYQGNSGGLIDRLLSQLGTQGQYQPSPGFPQPDPNAAPIGVGNYQMPRMGNADLYQPQQVMTPPASQPTQGQYQPISQPGESVLPRQTAEERAAGMLPAQMQPQQSSVPLPPQLQQPGNGFGNHLIAGAQNFSHAGALIPAIVNGITGLATGERTDPQGIQAQNLRTQLQTLIAAGVPYEKAVLATINPEFAKTIIPDVFGGDKYAFTTLPDGTVVRQNAKTGEVAPAYQGGTKPTFGIVGEEDGKKVYGWQDPTRRSITPYQVPGSTEAGNTVTGPDGKPIAIPPGVDRKTFVNEVSRANAKAAAGEKTEVQAKSEMFANKMESAEGTLKDLQGEGASFWNRVADGSEYLPGSSTAGRYLQSKDYQRYKQASSNFITALLRQESGAAISKDEFTRYEREYMPLPGDSKEVIAQKAEARRVAIEGMKKGAGPGYKSPTNGGSSGSLPSDPLGIR